MKGSHLYLIAIGVCLMLVFLSQYFAPHEFNWTPSFDGDDKEPFGCFVFDDVTASSVDDYSVTDKTFYQLLTETDSATPPRAFLLVENYAGLTGTDVSAISQLLHAGNKVMICLDYIPYTLSDSLLCFKTESYSYVPEITHYLRTNIRDSIFSGGDTINPAHVCEVFPQMHVVSLEVEEEGRTADCADWEMLAWNSDNAPLAVRVFIGKGELFFVSTPLMFTNFGILDGNNASYAFRLLSYMKDLPLVRTEAYGRNSRKSSSPLRYILSEPPLRWAAYSALALIALFMAFSAKRRQRVIPVVAAPPNRAFGFMQLVGSLYYRRHDNVELLQMKFSFFRAEVKRLSGIDLHEGAAGEDVYGRLSLKTGMEKDALRAVISNINMRLYRAEVSDGDLKTYIDGMNNILHALKT
jgi:hypothetical protein